MGLFDQWGYTNFHELNLDWILRRMRDLITIVENFVALNTIKYADPIQWNITTQYEANTVVLDPQSGTAYISTKPVPAGVGLTNTDYWTVIFTLDVISANKNITLRDDGSNVLATFASAAGDWLLWNGTLYKVSQAINTNEAYVVGYNLDRYTVEMFIADYVDDIKNDIGELTDLNTTVKDSLVNAINSIITERGALSDLDTSDQTSIVNAINEVVDDVDNVIINNTIYVSVKKYGAVGDGSTDDTTAIQTAFNNEKNVYFPRGTYLVSSTITVRNDTHVYGCNRDNAIILRSDTMSGATFQLGTTSLHFNSGIIEGLGFKRTFTYSSTGVDHPLGSYIPHLDLIGGQLATIRDCRIDGCPCGIRIRESSLVDISNNNIQGSIWDVENNSLHESVAAIIVGYATSSTPADHYTQLIHIHDNRIGGYQTLSNQTRQVGDNTYTGNRNNGSLYGILVLSCEGLFIHDNYLGGSSYTEIQFSPSYITTDINISENYLECGDQASIVFSGSSTYSVTHVVIDSNEFNEQLQGINAIYCESSALNPNIADLVISNNTFHNILASAMFLNDIRGCVVTGNSINSYNHNNLNPSNENYNSGIVIYQNCHAFVIKDNLFGGGVNNMIGGYCVNGVHVNSTGGNDNLYIDVKEANNLSGYYQDDGDFENAIYSINTETSLVQATTTLVPVAGTDTDNIVNNAGTITIGSDGIYAIDFGCRLKGAATNTGYMYIHAGAISRTTNIILAGSEQYVDNHLTLPLKKGDTIYLQMRGQQSGMSFNNGMINITRL